jgi:hypothetical protein
MKPLFMASSDLACRLGASLHPQGPGEHLHVKLKAGSPDLWWAIVKGAKE